MNARGAAAMAAAMVVLPSGLWAAGPAASEPGEQQAQAGPALQLAPGREQTIAVRSSQPTGRLEIRPRPTRCGPRASLEVQSEHGERAVLDVSRSPRWVRVLMPLPAGRNRITMRLKRTGSQAASCRLQLARSPRLLPRTVKLGAAAQASLLSDKRYVRTLVRNFDSLTPENELKMERTQPQAGRFDFRGADALVGLASRHGMSVRGHTLIYGKQLPPWVYNPKTPWTRKGLLRVMRRHIATVVGRYRGRVGQWDVVNEAIDHDGGFTPNVWYKVIGPSYIAEAFRAARKADPSASLFINEIGVEADATPQSITMRKLVRRLKRRAVPIDGVGLQNHTKTVGYPRSNVLEPAMRSFARLGLQVEITEMDVVTSGRRPRSVELRDQAFAYTSAERACRAVTACPRITAWGFTDRWTWRGPQDLPLLFDKQYRRKPAFIALARGAALPARVARPREEGRARRP